MRLSAYVQFYLKDVPPGFAGLTGEALSIGRDEVVPFDAMCAAFIKLALTYHLLFADAATLNAALERLRAALAGLRVEDV